MLRQLRNKKVMKPILRLLAVVITLAFVLWGASAIVERRKCVGIIFGRKVFDNEFVEAWEAEKNSAILNYGSAFFDMADQLDLRNRAWERLIMLEEARKDKIKVSDEEVRRFVASIPYFRDENGAFDNERYEIILRNTFNCTPRRFEEDMRSSLMIGKLNQQAVGDVSVSEEEIDAELKRLEGLKAASEQNGKKPVETEEELARKREGAKNNLVLKKRIQAITDWRSQVYERAGLINYVEKEAEEEQTIEEPAEEGLPKEVSD